MNRILAIIIALGVLAFVLLDGMDHTRRMINPKGYWESRRDVSTEQIDFLNRDVRYCALELAKLDRVRDIVIAQGELSGLTNAEAVAAFDEEREEKALACTETSNQLEAEKVEQELAAAELARLRQ
ncbi:MAG: hypothetical protein H6978_10390 [Gammaproteobacteria bacterium]|nr:hypothetical protein [Gammaproteobacteria bacterium]